MYSLAIYDDAEKDLDALWDSDEDAAADIDVLLDEIRGDQNLLDLMTVDGYVGDKFDVVEMRYFRRTRLNIWRLKAGYLEADWTQYRIIYAFEPKKKTYHVLAVMPREKDYEKDRQFVARLERAYDDLGIPRI